MYRLIAALWLALFALPAAAQNFPANGGSPVVDQADLLRPEQELDLKSKSEALYAQTGRALVIGTVKSLEGQEIEPYATALFRKWGIGDKERDDGVLLLVAPNERKVRIEPGYGAEGFLPDILAGRIIRETILPKFKQSPPDYGGGIVAGADAIIAQLQLPPDEARSRAEQMAASEKGRQVDVNPLPVIFFVIVFFVVIGSIAKRAGGRRYRSRSGINPWIILWGLSEISRASHGRGGWGGGGWGGGGWGGGGGGGGFGGFGGGSSGGGGASGSW